MWSFGCIVAELFLGLPLFSGASEYDLLKRMIEILGYANFQASFKISISYLQHCSYCCSNFWIARLILKAVVSITIYRSAMIRINYDTHFMIISKFPFEAYFKPVNNIHQFFLIAWSFPLWGPVYRTQVELLFLECS